MTVDQKRKYIKLAIIAAIIGIGYIAKGLPMAAALAVGIFIVMRFKRQHNQQNKEE